MDYNNQKFINQFKDKISEINPDKILFVCSSEYDRYGYRRALDDLGKAVVSFTAFEPCPEVSSVRQGMKMLVDNECDFIVAVGGGSAIDVAKGIKYYLESDIKILAVPTTAGTGAEVTRYSVLYNNGDKESVRSFDIIPEYQIFDYETLKSLPHFQRVVTGLDAFCHSVEAYWSVNATDESREYSIKALELFQKHFTSYLNGDDTALEPMMLCSELAGRAINIAQTTAPHAMSYKLHKLRGFAHGQAVSICLAYIWKYMEQNGSEEIKAMCADTEKITGFTPDSFILYLKELELLGNIEMNESELYETINGVNPDRLNNHPMKFELSDIEKIYLSFIFEK